jgi:GTPase SAR1 family protein
MLDKIDCTQLNTIPIIGFSVKTLKYKSFNLISWDVSCNNKLRVLWRQNYINTDAIIFVIDSFDRDRIDEASDEFWKLINEDELRESVILIMANKQDKEDTMSIDEISGKLKLAKLNGRRWQIQKTSAINNEGIEEGLEWIRNMVNI